MRALTLSGGSILARVATSASKTSETETDVAAKKTVAAIKTILRRSMTSADGTIMNAIGDCFSEGMSCDGVFRVHRFQRVMGKVIEDCDASILVAASTYASCRVFVLDAQRAQNQVSDTARKMKQMEESLEQITSERDVLLHSIESLRASHAKDVARTNAVAEANAAGTKELLLEEKLRAEDQARQYHGRMIQAEEQYQKASALEEEARTNLERAKAAISELSQRYEELEIQAKDEAERKVMAEEEAQELKQDLEEAYRELNEKSEDLSELEKVHSSTTKALQVAESSNSDLRTEMEDAYSRLVSLAQLFQVREDDLSKANTTNRDELRRARREAEDLASKHAVAEERAGAIERENDELRRKVTRLKKELEKERSRKANGPVGYFNKLHDDFEEKEIARRERSEKSERRSGKENGDRVSSRSRASSRARDGAESQRRFHIAR
jgi:chromosome segregation ATPase